MHVFAPVKTQIVPKKSSFFENFAGIFANVCKMYVFFRADVDEKNGISNNLKLRKEHQNQLNFAEILPKFPCEENEDLFGKGSSAHLPQMLNLSRGVGRNGYAEVQHRRVPAREGWRADLRGARVEARSSCGVLRCVLA